MFKTGSAENATAETLATKPGSQVEVEANRVCYFIHQSHVLPSLTIRITVKFNAQNNHIT